MSLNAKKLARLLRELSSPEPSDRRSAAEALSEGDERALYSLVKTLHDNNIGVQDAAMRSLIAIGGEITAYMVLPLLRDDACSRNTALIILKEIGAEAIPLLYPLLSDKDDDVRKFVIDLITESGQCNYPEAVANLLSVDPNPNVRAAAAKAVASIQYTEALPKLLAALRDEEWVCFSALEALATMKDALTPESIEAIASLLENPSDAVRFAAIEALGNIGSPLSSEALLRRLSVVEGFEKTEIIKSLVQTGLTPDMPIISEALMEMLRDNEWEDKLIALKGLAELRHDKAIHTIIDVAGSLDLSEPENEERMFVIKDALRGFGCAEALTDIIADPSIRYRGKAIAIDVAGDLGCTKVTPHLIALLETNIKDLRRASIKALNEMKDDEATQAVTQALEDYDGDLRKIAVTALGRIADRASFATLLKALQIEEYKDVMEELVRALIRIDAKGLASHLAEFSREVKEMIGRDATDASILLPLSRDEELAVRVAALSGLGKVHDKQVYARLAEALGDTAAEMRRAAVISMGRLNCCHDEIKSALTDPDIWVRVYAVEALGNSSRQDFLEILKTLLEDQDVPVVLSSIDAIVRLGGPEVTALLSPLLNHREQDVREKAGNALDSLSFTSGFDQDFR